MEKEILLTLRECKEVESGTFTPEGGQTIQYDGYLKVVCDYKDEVLNKIVTNSFRVDKNNVNLISYLKGLVAGTIILAKVHLQISRSNNLKMYITEAQAE